MFQRIFTTLTAIVLVLLCAAKVSAASGQQVLTLPAGGPYKLSPKEVSRQVGNFEALAVTLPPAPERAVLFLDGKALHSFQIVSKTEVEKISVFASHSQPYFNIGVVTYTRQPQQPDQEVRVKCINPFYLGQDDDERE